jgi:hypothetical protein
VKLVEDFQSDPELPEKRVASSFLATKLNTEDVMITETIPWLSEEETRRFMKEMREAGAERRESNRASETAKATEGAASSESRKSDPSILSLGGF